MQYTSLPYYVPPIFVQYDNVVYVDDLLVLELLLAITLIMTTDTQKNSLWESKKFTLGAFASEFLY